jgi:hypothetical protein
MEHDKKIAESQRSLADAKAEIDRLIAECDKAEIVAGDAAIEIAKLTETNKALNEAATQSVDACQRLTRCVKAADAMRSQIEPTPETLYDYDEARKLVKI